MFGHPDFDKNSMYSLVIRPEPEHDCLQTFIATMLDISHDQPLLLLSTLSLPLTAPSPET